MATVSNGKRTLTVEESTVDVYLKQGYDQVELSEDEKSYVVVKRATGGKQVSYAEYVEVLEQLEELKENDLTKENKSLKAKVTKLEKELEETKVALAAKGEGGEG